VGFPIRKFTDQSLFAAPHDLSQRTTSFIASQRQGIHQIPLRHLIALIAKARVGPQRTEDGRQKKPMLFRPPMSAIRLPTALAIRKDQFCFKRIRGSERSGSKPTTGCSNGKMMTRRLFRSQALTGPVGNASPHPAFDRMRFLFTMSEIEDRKERRRTEILLADRSAFVTPSACALNETDKSHRKDWKRFPSARHASRPQGLRPWWSQTGSNRRPHACKARALPTELWPRFKTRGQAKGRSVVGLGGLEPPTSRLSSARSNQLSYKPGRKKKSTLAMP
jgi:hypothetical protein